MKVYIITETNEQSPCSIFTLSHVLMVFGQQERAQGQLEKIKDKICNGGWYMDKNSQPLYGEVLSDYTHKDNLMGILRDVQVKSPNGIRTIYRLIEKEVNGGFFL